MTLKAIMILTARRRKNLFNFPIKKCHLKNSIINLSNFTKKQKINVLQYSDVYIIKMQSLINFATGGSPEVQILLNDEESRRSFKIRDEKGTVLQRLPIYQDDDDVSGIVKINMKNVKKFEHLGIKIELIGHIEIINDKNQSSDFINNTKQLEPAGTLQNDVTYKFNFPKFDKQSETFQGSILKLRYFVRATIKKNYNMSVVQTRDLAIIISKPETDQNTNILKMEVGIEDHLHIEFQYAKNIFHLKDCLLGQVTFHLVKLKIQMMIVSIIQKEISSKMVDKKVLSTYEVMEGCPAKDEVIPIRIYLAGVFGLTPSLKTENEKFQIKHYLNLVLIDSEDKRYYKEQEIQIYRKK